MVNDQPRNQQGKGGNMLLLEPSDATVTLSVFDRHDATFEYPSLASSAQYCVNFWCSIPIQDRMYNQLRNAHHKHRVSLLDTPEIMEQVRVAATEVFLDWTEDYPDHSEDPETRAAKWEEILAKSETEIVGPVMDSRDAPVIARAALMYRNAPGEQFEDERETVMRFEVLLVGGMTTVAEIAESYRTEDIYWAVSTEPESRDQTDLMMAIKNLQFSIEDMAGISSLAELADQQRALLAAVESSTKLQQPVAKLAQKQLDDRVRDYEDNLRARSLANIEAAAQRREARGEKR